MNHSDLRCGSFSFHNNNMLTHCWVSSIPSEAVLSLLVQSFKENGGSRKLSMNREIRVAQTKCRQNDGDWKCTISVCENKIPNFQLYLRSAHYYETTTDAFQSRWLMRMSHMSFVHNTLTDRSMHCRLQSSVITKLVNWQNSSNSVPSSALTQSSPNKLFTLMWYIFHIRPHKTIWNVIGRDVSHQIRNNNKCNFTFEVSMSVETILYHIKSFAFQKWY